MKKVYRHELVEVIIPAGSGATKFMVPDQPNLRNMQITGIEAYVVTNTPKSPLSGNDVISVTDLKKIYMTLVDNAGDEFMHLEPLGTFRTIEDDGTNPNIERDFKTFVGQLVNWPKSYLTMSTGLGNVGDLSVLFSVFYLDPNKKSNTTFRGRR